MTSRRVTPVFVGRRRDLDLLEAAFRRARRGTPLTVLVGGEAGVGKTRLVEEFLARAEVQEATVLVGGCITLGDEGLPFAPVVTALRGFVRHAGPEALVSLAGYAAPDLTRLLPELGLVTGPPPPGDAPPGRLHEVLAQVLSSLAEQRPLVLVVEDLHWADPSTRDFVAFCVRALRDVPALVVGTYRSDEVRRGHPLRGFLAELDRLRGVERLSLAPLDRAGVRAQLAGILDTVPPADMVDRVHDRSQGNPFFVEELAMAEAQGGRCALTDSLRQILLARVERLGADAQHVLRVAAAGAFVAVSHTLLSRVADLPEPVLLEGLRAAVDGHVLVPDLDRDAYRFRHALVQEAVHDELLPGEHARLHLRFAEEIEADPALGGDTRVAAVVAHHYLSAHDLRRALSALLRAAGEAREVYAFAEQQSVLERALQIWDRVPDAVTVIGGTHTDLLLATTRAAMSAGALDRALALSREAVAEADHAGLRETDPERAADVLTVAARITGSLGKPGGLDLLQEALSLLPERPTPIRARVLSALSTTYLMKPLSERAIELATEAAEAGRALGDSRVEARALITRGTARVDLGDPDAGLDELERARAILQETGDESGLIRFHTDLSDCLMNLGRYDEATRVAREGTELAARLGQSRTWGVGLVGNAVEPLVALGQWDDARALAQEALDLDPQGVNAGNLHQLCGSLALARGDVDEADHHLQAAHALFRRPTVSLQFLMPFDALAAGIAAARGRLDDVRRHVRAGLERGAAKASRYAWPLLVRGAVAESDAASEARLVERDPDPGMAEMLDWLEAAARDLVTRSDNTRALAARLTAEIARARGVDTPGQWAKVVATARDDARPHPLAAVLIRYAEACAAGADPRSRRRQDAGRVEAIAAVREAGSIAGRLGARPLVAEAERLGRRLGVALSDDTPSLLARPEHQRLGLTAREMEVLRLIAAGRSNRQIAEALFISPKTASVHVSNIIAKLGVSGRVEAAAVAHRRRLFDEVVH